jgi:O-antigen/teichoic acid export membrane protein
MLLRNTLLYLPAQIVGPLAQLVAMIVWTHVVDEPTLGVITLVTATHELLQIAFLAWWSQYALRFLGRYLEDGNAARFYRTENAVLLASAIIQSLVVIAILFIVISPEADARLVLATVACVITRTVNLYIGERARVRHQIGVYTIQVTLGPALGFVIGLVLIQLIDRSAAWPLAGYAVAQLAAAVIVVPRLECGRGLWPLDRDIIDHALRYGTPLIVGGALGWVGLNASRFIVNDMLGVAAAGLFAVGYGLGQRAATFAAMLVTAAAFPLAVKSMERHGATVAMRQLADNSALLIAILAPCITGIYVLRVEIVHLLIAPVFQAVTLAILPLSVLAGSVRSLRAHFVDQTFLLHNRTGLLAVVAAIDAGVTVLLSFIFVHYWGLTGAAGATVVAALVGAVASFVIAFSRFGLTLPIEHLAPLTIATALLAAL